MLSKGETYRDRSKLIVVFIGEKYQDKKWCGVEFKAIRDVLFDKKHEKIMYIRTDNSKVDGVFNTDGYIDATTHKPEEIANFIVERIKQVTAYNSSYPKVAVQC
jgi:hypothetical protein